VRNVAENLPSEDLLTLFDTFVRGSKVGDQPGWGLGLSFVRRIAEKHGGWLSARHDNGQVSFTIHLPASMAVAGTSAGAR
jgi:two-component system sensor histidine kinase MprB